MSKLACLGALALLSLSSIQLEAVVNGTWNINPSGNWGDAANWTSNPNIPGVAPGTGNADSATFGLNPAHMMGTVTLAGAGGVGHVDPLLNVLTFNTFPPPFTNVSDYTIVQAAGAGTLRLTTSPSINVQTGTNTIDAPTTIDSDTSILVDLEGLLVFGANSNFLGTLAGHTLTIASTSMTFDAPADALTTSSTVGNGFADNMSILIIGNPTLMSVVNTSNFGLHAPTITLSGRGTLINQLLGAAGTVGSSSTDLVLTNLVMATGGGQIQNTDPSAVVNGKSLSVLGSFNSITNNGKIHITNDVTLTAAPSFNLSQINLQTNPVTTGNGAEFTIGGNFVGDAASTALNFVSQNSASVSVGPHANGSKFQIIGTGNLSFSSGSGWSNQNELDPMTSDTISGDPTNVGALFDATDTVFLGGISGTPFFNNDNGMPVSGGTGAKTIFKSMNVSFCSVRSNNTTISTMPPLPTNISGTESIGCHILVNFHSLVGQGASFNNGATLNMTSGTLITGTNTVGSKLEILLGDLSTTLNGNINCSSTSGTNITGTGNIGALIDVAHDISLSNPLFMGQATQGITCSNGDLAGTSIVNGDPATVGAFLHGRRNAFLSNGALLKAYNTSNGQVNINGGIGALIKIDGTMFTMTNTPKILVQNDGPLTDYGVGAQLDAAPQLVMGGGVFEILNTASLTNNNLNTNFAAAANLVNGFACNAGTVTIDNLNPLSPGAALLLAGANGAILNVEQQFDMAASTHLNMSNGMTLLPGGLMRNMGGSLGSVLKLDTITPFDMTIAGTVALTNTYAVVNIGFPIAGSIAAIGSSSIGVQFIASRNLSLSSGAQMSLSNNLAVAAEGVLINSVGIQVTVAGTLNIDSATLSATNSGNFSMGFQMMLPPDNYVGSQVNAPTMNILNTGVLNITNTGSDQQTLSTGSQVNTTILSIQDSGQLNLHNTGGNFSVSSQGTALVVNGSFDMSGAYLTNVTSGETVDGTSFGSLIQSTMGPIDVNRGTFINDAQVQSDIVNVAAGSPKPILAGNGTFEGAVTGTNTTVNNSGRLYPGDPVNPITKTLPPAVGTMTINGTYNQQAMSDLFINIHDLTTFSRLLVHGTGVANIDATATVTVSQLSGGTINQSDTYDILVADNGVMGMFDPTVQTTMGFPPLIPILTYPDPNTVRLIFAAAPPPPPSPPPSPPPPAPPPSPPPPPAPPPSPPPSSVPLLTSYSVSFEALFDLINRDNLILEREMQRMRLRYQQEFTIPARKASSRRVAQASSPAPAIITHNPFSIHTIANAAPAEGKELAFARYREEIEQQRMDEQMICTYLDRPWNFFIGPVGDVGTIKTKQNQLGADYWAAGALTSFNYVFSQGGIGLFVDYNKVKADVDQNWGNFNFDMAHSSFYATYSPKGAPRFALHSIVGGSYEWYNIHRHTTTNTANAKTHGGEFDALLSGEYVFSGSPCSSFPENFSIIPRAGLQYIYVNSHHYKEHGAGVSDLEFNSRHAQSLRTILDLWMKYTWEWTNTKFTPELNVGWQREFLDKNQNVSFTSVNLPLPTSSVTTFGAGRNTFLAGLDLFLEFYEKYALEASYDFQWNSLIRDNGFYLGFHARF